MSTLISEAYRAEQKRMHENPDYGVASLDYARYVAELIRRNDIGELLDYGAGKGRLGLALAEMGVTVKSLVHYEPADARWSAAPQPAEMVACIDVLEHVEPQLLDNVLDDLQRVTGRLGFFTVHTGPAIKTLSDGSNAHLIQQGPAWWLPRFLARFELELFQKSPGGFFVIVTRKD